MKNLKTLLLICLLACTLVFTACGNKNASQEDQSSDKNEKILEMLMKAEGASEEEKAQVKCMIDLTAKMATLKGKLTSNQKEELGEQFDLMEDSPEECINILDTLSQFELEILSK